MPYKSYLIQAYDTTHENNFFRKFSDSLADKFQHNDSLAVLIGNLSCNGHQIDALFIQSGQITVIDFKNYGGKLIFSENNPWTIEFQGKKSFVSGGSNIRNPFQQINAYRRSLIDYLNHRLNSILSGNRDDFKLGHISGIVMFHQSIEFDNNTIPSNIPYFHITDYKNSVKCISSIKSKNLLLSDKEISNIISNFNINDTNLFDTAKIVELPKTHIIAEQRLNLVKKLVKDIAVPDKIEEKILSYYYILLNLESYKESDFKSKFILPTKFENLEADSFTIDFNVNTDFLKRLESNKNQTFPDNIFVGIAFKIGDEKKVLLHQIIIASEINYSNKQNIVKASNFELYTKTLFELNLPENYIEELNFKIIDKKTLSEKIDCLRLELDTLEIKLIDNLVVGFSNKNLTNSQCASEINKLKNESINDLGEGFINNFLLNNPITDNILNNKTFKYIKITKLNGSQELAVKSLFSNKLTIITGPPGTGKTQVVMNIIANAIINNKTILFASKNNKAVDNVRDRFKHILKDDYLIRIGSRDIITNIQKPNFKSFINKINSQQYSNNLNELKKQSNEIDKANQRISKINDLFSQLEILQNEILSHKQQLEKLSEEYQAYIKSIPEEENDLFIEQNKAFSLNTNDINLLLRKLNNSNNSFFSKLIYKWFRHSKTIENVNNFEKSIDNKVLDYINSKSPFFINGKSNLKLIINHLNQLIGVYYISQKHISFKISNQKKQNFEKKQLDDKTAKFNRIKQHEIELKSELIELDTKLIDLSSNYLNIFIANKLSTTTPAIIENYSNYIPENIPWERNRIPDFVKACKMIISKFHSVCVTNLSIKNGFSLTKELFDILVIDEGSQCDIASAIPLIFRAKQVVIIGDPLQLRHITTVQKYEENFIKDTFKLDSNKFDYVNKSLFDFANELANLSNIPTYFLNEHFRCHPKIIGFSNDNFYIPKLGRELDIKTTEKQFTCGDKGIVWYNVLGDVAKSNNFNKVERDKVIKLAKELLETYPNCKIGITTPFHDQEELLTQEYSKFGNNKERVVIQTIHKFQGDERDIIIISLVVNNDCKSSLPNFINIYAPYLLNVAATRAKSSLYIVGDFNYCKNQSNSQKEDTLLTKLAKYVEKHGQIISN